MLAALSITATLAARSSRSVVGDTQSDEEACSAACACSGILSGFQSFGHCPSAASIHNRCAKLVLPSCEPKSRQVESMARIQPHPDPLEVCELPHVRDESLLVVTFLNRPSRLFHSLLEGVAASGARLIVLGYGTDPAKVKDKLMLQAGLKIVAAHAFFVRCKSALPASKVVLFLDGSDTVLQLPAAEVVSRYRAYYDNKLVVSTEPGTFWANEAEKAAYRGLYPSNVLSGANPHHGINTGTFVGIPSALRNGFRAMINAAAQFSHAGQLPSAKGAQARGKERLMRFDATQAAKPPPFNSEHLMQQVFHGGGAAPPPILAAHEQMTAMRMYVSGNSSFTLDYDALLSASIGHGGSWERDEGTGRVRHVGLNVTPAVLHVPGMGKTRICAEPALHTYLRESRGRAPPPDDTVEFFDLDFRRLQVPRSTWELVRLPPNMCTRHCPRDCVMGVAPRTTLAGGGGRSVEGRGPVGNKRKP